MNFTKVKKRAQGAFILDLRALAAFRITLGFTLICDLLQDFIDAPALYTREGVLPRTLWARIYEFTALWSVHLFNDSVFGVRLMLGAQICVAVMFVIGYRTRLATVLTWILFVSLLNRNIIATDGGDQISSLLLFAAMFLPLGTRYSVDSLKETKKATPSALTFIGLGGALLIFQMSLMYVFAGFAKLMTPSWWTGEALDITLRWTEYTKPFAEVVRSQPALTRLATWVTPWFEIFAPLFFIFNDRRMWLRTLAVSAFLMLHVSIDATLRLGFFSSYSVAGLIALLPPHVWDFLEKKLKAPTDPTTNHLATISYAGIRTPWRNAAVLFIFLCSAYSTLPALLGEKRAPYPNWVARINDLTFGYQNWNLFREPLRTSGWYRAKAELNNGNTVDLFQPNAPYSEDRPYIASEQFSSRRWLSFIMHSHMQWEEPDLRSAIARVLAQEWNAGHTDPEQIRSLSIIYFREDHPAFLPSVPLDSYEYAKYPTE